MSKTKTIPKRNPIEKGFFRLSDSLTLPANGRAKKRKSGINEGIARIDTLESWQVGPCDWEVLKLLEGHNESQTPTAHRFLLWLRSNFALIMQMSILKGQNL